MFDSGQWWLPIIVNVNAKAGVKKCRWSTSAILTKLTFTKVAVCECGPHFGSHSHIWVTPCCCGRNQPCVAKWSVSFCPCFPGGLKQLANLAFLALSDNMTKMTASQSQQQAHQMSFTLDLEGEKCEQNQHACWAFLTFLAPPCKA